MTTTPRTSGPLGQFQTAFRRFSDLLGTADARIGAPDRIEPLDRLEDMTDLEREALTEREGFLFLQDRFTLPREPDVEGAVEIYIGAVAQAYRNDAALHPHAVSNRTEAQMVEQGYVLDFREFEMARIRDKLPADAPAQNFIDLFADRILLTNLERYTQARRDHFLALTETVHLWPTRLAWIALGALFLVAVAVVAAAGGGGPAAASWTIAGLGGLALAVGPLAAFEGWRRIRSEEYWWSQIIEKGLVPLRERYEEAVRDAGGLVASVLYKKSTELLERTEEIKSRLDKLGAAEKKRVEDAPVLVQLLLWFPERIGFIENYYRVRLDQFVKLSARDALEAVHWRRRYQAQREELVDAFRRSFAILALAGIGGLAMGPAAVPEALMRVWPDGWPALEGLVSWSGLAMLGAWALALGAASVLQAGIEAVKRDTGRRLAPTATRIEPDAAEMLGAEIAAAAEGRGLGHRAGLVLGSVVFFGLCAAPEGMLVAGAAAGIAAVMIAQVRSEIDLADRLFVTNTKRLSANVIQAVIQKMEATGWARYNDSRLDEKLADIFSAVYKAWYDAYVGSRFNPLDRG